MDRTRQHTIIDLDEGNSRRPRVIGAIIALLIVALVIAPFILDNAPAPADAPSVTLPAERAAPPELCYPSFDVPDMLDPVARLVLPGWTRFCTWLSQPGLAGPTGPPG